ncbi:MAG: hypothetical protein FIA89_13815 [Geobacter sp.]|nr:hypothetical protein [Geobacter sp.]
MASPSKYRFYTVPMTGDRGYCFREDERRRCRLTEVMPDAAGFKPGIYTPVQVSARSNSCGN